jgi:hypothetical protein
MEAARLAPRRQDYLREVARLLCIHSRFFDAEPFASRLVGLDPTPENQDILEAIVKGLAESPETKAGRSPAARPPDIREAAPAGIVPSAAPPPLEKPGEPAEDDIRPTLLSRLFRPRT